MVALSPRPRPVSDQAPVQSRGKAQPPYTLTFPGAGRGCWDTCRGVKPVPAWEEGVGQDAWEVTRTPPFSTSLWMLSPAHPHPQRLGTEEGAWDRGTEEG